MKQTPTLLASVAAFAITGAAHAQQVFATDLIVQGSACVGIDCVSSESFGFDTIRMKENNTRLKFDDTSTSGSFPNNDWQLTANDSSNGGANKFSIDDVTNGRVPFTVEANTPTNALFVEDTGHVGFGTNNPVVNLHAVEGNTPTLRLEQDGSSGFTPYTWDMAGNETNFFIRDVNGGSALSFRIFPGNENDDGLVIRNGRVGVQTDNPSHTLHVRKTDGTAKLMVEDTGGAGANINMLQLISAGGNSIVMENSTDSHKWRLFQHLNNTFKISSNGGSAADEFVLDSNGNLTLAGTITTTGTTCGGGCDLVFTDEYEILPIEQRAALMWENGYLPNVGPTIENEAFDLTDKLGRMLNELEHAHIYIEQLHKRLEVLEAERG
ncbi:hypothetical protein [uncultured Shimia sp.]|uniref:hypothetical protein n=1 Tax=uncultured Shimia sp. TaxID=573152 RepID=UPI0026317C36|nr:hypothetical protein [uncultured Shimia sp.]